VKYNSPQLQLIDTKKILVFIQDEQVSRSVKEEVILL